MFDTLVFFIWFFTQSTDALHCRAPHEKATGTICMPLVKHSQETNPDLSHTEWMLSIGERSVLQGGHSNMF